MTSTKPERTNEAVNLEDNVCGIAMPIAQMDGYSQQHWDDVRAILYDGIAKANFIPKMVNYANEATLIHKTIIVNLAENPVVVVDVSGKNPNVMFELGLRLAFDKPVIIVKDHETPFSFDTSGVEHLLYPRDLRYADIVKFKETLATKIVETFKKYTDNPDSASFLKTFGPISAVKIEKTEITASEFIIEELKNLRIEMQRLSSTSANFTHTNSEFSLKYKINIIGNWITVDLGQCDHESANRFLDEIRTFEEIDRADILITENSDLLLRMQLIETENSYTESRKLRNNVLNKLFNAKSFPVPRSRMSIRDWKAI